MEVFYIIGRPIERKMDLTQAIALVLRDATIRRRALVTVAAVCGFAAATAIAAQVRIHLPFSPVPVTMQTFVVLLAGVVLGSRAGAASQALYLGLGACGLPVFTGGSALLTGATAGYLLAFPVAAWIAGALADRGRAWTLAGLVLSCMVIYLLGTGWLCLITGKAFGAGLMLGVVPFIAGDAMKLAGIAFLAAPCRKAWRRFSGG